MRKAAGSSTPSLVPGRECGECTACCTNLRIDEKKLQKPANVECIHLTSAKACGIYASRPATCKSFHCGWRMLGGLGDEWRPDRLKVMARVERDGIVLEGLGSMKPLLVKSVMDFIGTCVHKGVTIFISIPGKPGHCAAKLELNQLLVSAATQRQRSTVMRELIRAAAHGIPTPRLAPMTYPLTRVIP
jgi:hypothetical protein